MRQDKSFLKVSVRSFVTIACFSVCTIGWGQAKTSSTMPDAQIEANVLKALASAPQLAGQSITTTTVYGTVTISGIVPDEASRDTAEHLVANAAGVQKVVDELTIGVPPAPTNPPASEQGAPQGPSGPPAGQGQFPPPNAQQPQGGPYPPPNGQYPQSGQHPPSGQYPPPQGQYPPSTGSNGSSYGPPPSGYPQQPQRPFVAQKGGDPVLIPSGSILRVRINQGMDSKHTAPGTLFDGLVLNDVVAGGFVAIPRGSAIRGTVVDVHKAGDFKGKGELKLQLTQVDLGGKTYPITTDFWWHQGADKTGNTVGNTVGLGAMGALIGAVAGGGVGAAVGAGVGGVAGLGVSSVGGRGEAVLPSEAIISFHLTQPTNVTTVSQSELNRLASAVPAGAPAQMRRRSGYPPPPPPYGPGYYPPPY
jgi:BON domain